MEAAATATRSAFPAALFTRVSFSRFAFIVSDKLQRLDPVPCGDHKFQCGDGSCIHISFACDGEPDCADHSDENPKECRNRGKLRIPFFPLDADLNQQKNIWNVFFCILFNAFGCLFTVVLRFFSVAVVRNHRKFSFHFVLFVKWNTSCWRQKKTERLRLNNLKSSKNTPFGSVSHKMTYFEYRFQFFVPFLVARYLCDALRLWNSQKDNGKTWTIRHYYYYRMKCSGERGRYLEWNKTAKNKC